ncbi:MAG: ACP S-malonyltransferase [Catenulispora sp.]|nr:ACP S-malonyltransferase [Catenulispora sp.]
MEEGTQAAESPAVAWIFPGQGAQRPGMGLPWRDDPSWSVVDQISEIAGRDVGSLLLDADADALRETDVAQLATFALEMVIADALRIAPGDGTPSPTAYAGHSLGEYSALAAAGILSLTDATRLVVARGRAMLAATRERKGTMGVLIGLSGAEADQLVKEVQQAGHEVWVANRNAADQFVVSGTEEGVDAVADAVVKPGRLARIPVAGAFHTPLMAPAAADLRAALVRTPFQPGRAVVVANVDAQPHDGSADWPGLATAQLTSPVLWADSVDVLIGELGCGSVLEIGPGKALTNLVKRSGWTVTVRSVSTPDAMS